jgi:hypothetical protein
VGYGFGTSNWVDPTDPGGATGNFNLTGFLVGATLGANFQVDSNTGNLRPAGVIGGLQGGANYEFAPWVVGVEGTWSDSAINGNTLIGCSGPCVIGKIPVSTPETRFTFQAQWLAAVTGRAGYAANDWLFYAKAGGAWMQIYRGPSHCRRSDRPNAGFH